MHLDECKVTTLTIMVLSMWFIIIIIIMVSFVVFQHYFNEQVLILSVGVEAGQGYSTHIF